MKYKSIVNGLIKTNSDKALYKLHLIKILKFLFLTITLLHLNKI